MELGIAPTGLDQVIHAYAHAPAVVRKHLLAAMEEAQMLLQREVAEATPTGAHQLLRKSIVAEPVQWLSDGLLGVVDVGEVSGKYGTALDYAVPVELGTKAHFPPIEPLTDWVKAKLGSKGDEAEAAARAIAWKIFRRGTEGAHMFANTHKAQAGAVQAIFARAAANIIEELGE